MATSTIVRSRTKRAPREIKKAVGLQLAEYDRAGILQATYVESSVEAKGRSRVDVLHPTERKQLWRKVLDVFLPDGYPNSVSDDYTPYQIFDSFQAFAGTIAGMISSRAVWEGLGVGDSTASPTGAMLIQVIRECMGKLGTIFFAHLMGTSIEAECKAYRLGADVLTDVAMILDCMSPWFPNEVRFLVLCLSSILFSAAGVAGGASKSSLSGHFAKWNNLGELNAKDGSQETVISLMGMMTGTLVVSWLTTPFLTWSALLALLALHLFLNRIGVRAVKMQTLNRQRANIAFSSLIAEDKILTPEEISNREVIFERRGGSVFRWNCGPVIGHCRFGVSINTLLAALSEGKILDQTGSMNFDDISLSELMHLFQDERYILWCHILTPTPFSAVEVLVVLKDGVTAREELQAWYHGLILAHRLCRRSGSRVAEPVDNVPIGGANAQRAMLGHIVATVEETKRTFDGYAKRLVDVGWNLDIAVLETSSGLRIKAGSDQS